MNSEHDATDDPIADVWLTIPNLLCVLRFVGAWFLIAFAVGAQPTYVVGFFLVLTATDLIDGKLARWLQQRSRIGPRLDTIADVTMYGCLLVATVILFGDILLQELILISVALLSYAASCLYAWSKFGAMPSYHTRAAKTCWLLIIVAVIALFFDWSIWPLRIALLGVTLTNIEAVLITRNLSEPRTDIRWLGDALARDV